MVKLLFSTKKNGDETTTTSPAPEQPARKPSMKINLSRKPQTPATEQAPALPSPAEGGAKTPKIKMSTKKAKAPAAVADDGETDELHAAPAPPPVQRQPTILKIGKRAAEMAPDGELPAKRPVKPTERAGSISFRVPAKPVKTPTLKLNTKLQPTPSNLKLKFGSAASSAVPQSGITPTIKIKAKGRPPKRDPGVGYDSEDEDAELDPVIENHFILRMQPGEDCDYLRAAIVESALKHKPDGSKALGPDVWLKFFDKEGRHGIVCVRGHMYAASLLDLPCIIEAQKSWDKKGWYKTTDICQILLVLGRIEKEEQAKEYPLPAEVDRQNWQYPHGLTPPMQWVRKRRFRKRVNRRHIERVEQDVEELLKADREWEDDAVDPTIDLEYVEPEAPVDESEMDAEGEEDDYDMEGYPEQIEEGNVYVQDGEVVVGEDAEGEDDLEALLMAGLAENEGEEAELPPGTTLVGDASMLQASPDTLMPIESAVTPASGVATSVTEDDDDEGEDEDDDEDDEAADDEEDEEERARRIEREQAVAEVEDLKKEVQDKEKQLLKQQNILLRNKIKGQLEKLRADLQVKQSGLGLNEEE